MSGPDPMEITPFHPFRSEKAKKEYLESYDAMAKNWPVPAETLSVRTSQGRTFVRMCGPGDASPLMLLPGGGATSLMWTPNVTALSQSHRVYAIDHIYDYGRSVCHKPF